ncbi:MAG: ChaB family protein [Quadrisphaera sp.]
MAMTTKTGKVREGELPSTLQRSDAKAQATFAKAHDSAEETYADEPNTEERARRTAFSALKHTHEKVGDHWEPKPDGRTGPSDAQAEGGAGTDRPHRGRGGRERDQGAPARPGAPARRAGALLHDQGRAGDRPATRQRREDRQGPRGLLTVFGCW